MSGMDRIEKLRAQLAAAKAATTAAREALSEDDLAELALRKEIAAQQAEQEAEERAARDLDLERRLDAAREKFGEKAILAVVAIKGRKDTFIIRHTQKAYEKWQREITSSVGGKKLDHAEVARAYAVAVVVDWNGETDYSDTSLKGHELIEHLRENGGIATAILNEALELAGTAKEERKSAR